MAHTAQQQNKAINPHLLFKQICDLSQSLLDTAQQEAQALVQNDFLAFSMLQDDKERIANNYLSATQQFHDNIEQFKRFDKKMITHLENIQSELNTVTDDNNKLISQIGHAAENFIKAGMKTALEYGESNRSHFENNMLVSLQKTAQTKTQTPEPNHDSDNAHTTSKVKQIATKGCRRNDCHHPRITWHL